MTLKPPAALITAACLVLAGCGQDLTGSGTAPGRDALYFTNSTQAMPPLYLGEPYTGTVTVAGGAGPYTARVTSGTLPPGLKLSGLTLSGKPSKVGAYKFSVEVVDSTLSSKVQEYTLNVNELPPLALKPTLPGGEIRGETRIPITLSAPRGVRAARVVWDLPAGASVSRVQNGDGNASGVVFWKLEGQRLTLDLGFKTAPRDGARVALVSVKPQKAVNLSGGKFGFEARDGEGKLIGEANLPAPAAPAAASALTPGAGPASGPANPDPASQAAQNPATPNPATPNPATPNPATPNPAAQDPAPPAPAPAPTPPTDGSKP